MEGLLIAQVLAALRPRVPAERLAWRFAGPDTFVLPLVPEGAVWFYARLPAPRIEIRDDMPDAGSDPRTPFQALLVARAVGALVGVGQPQLDRVARFAFGAGTGFVEQPPVTLIAELTGRNGNFLLLDDKGVILGAHREIGSDVNRYRQVRSGLPYAPPPPYDKLDPRSASGDELRRALEGVTLQRVKSRIDGIGPELTATLARVAGVDRDTRLEGAVLDDVLAALQRIVEDPTGTAADALERLDLVALRRQERRASDRRQVEGELRKRRDLVAKRERDVLKALDAAADADRLRREADVLLANAQAVPVGASHVTLPDFEGGTIDLELDPAKRVGANAEARYDQARRREARAARAEAQVEALTAEAAEIDAALAALDTASDEALRKQAADLSPAREQQRRAAGLRYPAPHGFTVVVGRNSRENDEVTFKVARSLDVWLHVQGWTGSHVVVLAKGREVPFDVILFAARLAAGHSKAAGGDNVPVDYTLRKYVWKVKGAPPGAVHFAHQKTVYVTPSRDPTSETTDR